MLGLALAAMTMFVSCSSDDDDEKGPVVAMSLSPVAPDVKEWGHTFDVTWTVTEDSVETPLTELVEIMKVFPIKDEDGNEWNLEQIVSASLKSVVLYDNGNVGVSVKSPFSVEDAKEIPTGLIKYTWAGQGQMRLSLDMAVLMSSYPEIMQSIGELDPAIADIVIKNLPNITALLGKGMLVSVKQYNDKVDMSIELSDMLKTIEPIVSQLLGNQDFVDLITNSIEDEMIKAIVSSLLANLPQNLKFTESFTVLMHFNVNDMRR